ncbi:MAG: GGDEF domain-containing protein [Candidatus Malihini olakiniferum]
MVKQSLAITRREYLTQPDLPSTSEFRRVAQAMNLIIIKLKMLFEAEAERSERLRQEAYQDPQTGLPNRRAFEMQFNDKISNEETPPGYLIIIRIQNLAGLNQRLGGYRIDTLLETMTKMMRTAQKLYAEQECTGAFTRRRIRPAVPRHG